MTGDRAADALRALARTPAGQRAWERLRPEVRAWAEPLIRAALGERRQVWEAAGADLDALRGALRSLERAVPEVAPRFDRTPLGPDMTVHAAHARDPRVQQVFARHGLPDCPSCAVGADETLAEAARAEGVPLEALLAELRALGLDDP